MAEPGKVKKKASVRKPSAMKRVRQSNKRAIHNRSMQSQMRNLIKTFRKEIVAKNVKAVEKLLKPTLATIAKMAGKNIIHKNKAANIKSKLTKGVAALK